MKSIIISGANSKEADLSLSALSCIPREICSSIMKCAENDNMVQT